MTAMFHYFGGLQALLVHRYQGGPTLYRFTERPAVKDAIEAMGIPHTEVDAVVINGCSVGFNCQLQPHDTVDVYPPCTPVPVENVLHLTPPLPDRVTFVIDVHLGKLARRLRLLGFDCLYKNDFADAEIIRQSLTSKRIILTRDRGLLKQRQVQHGYLVRSNQVAVQVREILDRYLLYDRVQPWSRCLVCNGLLEKVPKSTIEHRLETKTKLYYEDFHRCIECDRIFWPGSHFSKIETWFNGLINVD